MVSANRSLDVRRDKTVELASYYWSPRLERTHRQHAFEEAITHCFVAELEMQVSHLLAAVLGDAH
eukprot:2315974-Lingulodinium_polyedra.AAC.1